MDRENDRAPELIGRVESLLERLETLDGPARDTATEAVRSIVELYGEGLTRLVALATDRATGDEPPDGPGGSLAAWAHDELIAHLLLLHDLHPESPETRVGRALDEVRPYLRSHGGDVELVGVRDGVAHLRLRGSCDGCPSSRMTLEMAVEDAVRRLAPDVERIEAEGAAQGPEPTLVQLSAPPSGAGGGDEAATGPVWTPVGALPQLQERGLLVKEVGGVAVLFVRLDGAPYAYNPECPGCGAELAGGALRDDALTCAGCDRRYDVRRAGRGLDAPEPNLEPVPLLADDSGIVKVALPAETAR